MAIGPAPVLSAPASRGLRYGLLTAAGGPNDLPDEEPLVAGFRYEPVTCGAAILYPIECEGDPPAIVFDTADGLVTASPFIARATYLCGAVGTSPTDMEDRVKLRLANGEQTVAEAGMAAALDLAAVPIAADDPASIVDVVAALEQWLYGVATANYGHIGFIHTPVRHMAYASAAGLLVKNGPVWQTAMGTVWISGGGYPDDGTLYISGTTTVWRSPQVHVPPAAQVFDRVANEYRLIADRHYAVAFDCVAAAITFEPEVPLS